MKRILTLIGREVMRAFALQAPLPLAVDLELARRNEHHGASDERTTPAATPTRLGPPIEWIDEGVESR